jgi:NADH-quinone oxidoreductase subunit E
MTDLRLLADAHRDTRGGIIEFFHAVQAEHNYLPEEAIKEAARVFGVTEPQAYGVATFYSYLSTTPRGRYIVRMCESAPCHIAGADQILEALKKHLGIEVGETTSDGRFTLEVTQCVGQCQGTPVVTINSTPYVDVTPDQIPAILNGLE